MIGRGSSQFELIATGNGLNSTGGQISVISPGVIAVELDSIFFTGYNGGTLSLQGSNVIGGAPGAPTILQICPNSGGIGPTLNITMTGNAPQSFGGTLFLNPQGSTAGGYLNLSTQGVLTLDPNTVYLNVDPIGASGNGGTINLTAASFVNGSTTGPALVEANGKGTGNGGSVTLTQLSNTAVTLGKTVSDIQLSATGGSIKSATGDGGSVAFYAAGDLTVNTGGLLVGPLGTNGNGGSITLQAGVNGAIGAGNLVVSGILSVNGVGTGAGGAISLNANGSGNAGTFIIGSTSPSNTNGVLGALSATGKGGDGSVSITNAGGGITYQSGLTAFDSITLDASGSAGNILLSRTLGGTATSLADLEVSGSGTITGSGTAITAKSIDLSTASGAIGTAKTALSIKTSALSVSSLAVVNLNNTVTTPLTLETSNTGPAGSLTLADSGAIILGGAIDGGNLLSLKSSSSQSIAALAAADSLLPEQLCSLVAQRALAVLPRLYR